MTVLTASVRTVFYFYAVTDNGPRGSNAQPIGFFDSGVGGISIWSEVQRFLPRESTLYLADSRNAPYGPKGKEAVRKLAQKNTELLLEEGCKMIVVACNTATTMAIDLLRDRYEVPFIGIEPAIKPAAIATRTGKVGVLATKGTLASDLFQSTSSLHAAGITVIEQEGVGLVERIEKGIHREPSMMTYLGDLLQPMIDQEIDHLVLGCTHYGFLTPVLKTVLPESVRIVDCAWPVARQTAAVLMRYGRENTGDSWGSHRFFTNGDIELLRSFLPAHHSGIHAAFREF